MRTIAITGKGGAGKTAVAVNLAAALAARGRHVLLVDCDPQGTAADALGLSRKKPTLFEVLTGQALVAEAVRETAVEDLVLLPADPDLATFELELLQYPGWQYTLRRIVGAVAGQYDTVIVDSAPGLGVLPHLALVAATAVIVVCPPEFLRFGIVAQSVQMVERARAATDGGAQLFGIVPTFTTHRRRYEREALAALNAEHAGLVLTDIPRRAAVRDAQLAGEPINIYAPGSEAAAAFARLAEEVIRRGD